MRDELDAEKRQAEIVNTQNKTIIKDLNKVCLNYAKKIKIEAKRNEDLSKAIN